MSPGTSRTKAICSSFFTNAGPSKFPNEQGEGRQRLKDNCMTAFAAFDHQPRTRVVFGVGMVEQAGELAVEIGIKKALLVTDPGVVAAGHMERVRQTLLRAGIEPQLFGQVRENPTTRDVDDCLQAARAGAIDGIIGLGGGSSMDTAKGCNFLLTNGGRMQDYWGVSRAARPM